MTRGSLSSERKTAIYATVIGVLLGVLGIYMGSNLAELGVLIGVIVSPLSLFYPASRTIVKSFQGESDVQTVTQVSKKP